MHRDIKGANILTGSDGTIKLTDFGTSKYFHEWDKSDKENLLNNKSFKGTPFWMAPEIICRTGHNTPADIWSVGCVVLEMLLGHPPYSDVSRNLKEIFIYIASRNKPNYPSNISKKCKKFLDAVFVWNPGERPSAVEL